MFKTIQYKMLIIFFACSLASSSLWGTTTTIILNPTWPACLNTLNPLTYFEMGDERLVVAQNIFVHLKQLHVVRDFNTGGFRNQIRVFGLFDRWSAGKPRSYQVPLSGVSGTQRVFATVQRVGMIYLVLHPIHGFKVFDQSGFPYKLPRFMETVSAADVREASIISSDFSPEPSAGDSCLAIIPEGGRLR